MYSFYINTSTPESTIAVYADKKVLAENRWMAKQNEAEKLQPGVDKLLNKNKLSADDIRKLVVCIGPGGFTSARVGVSAVNAWAFAKAIPIAQATVFDLYDEPDTYIIISANSNEGWVKEAGNNPTFVNKGDYVWPKSFNFTGILNEDWIKYLEKHGGKFVPTKEKLPDISKLVFSKQIALPWYYKDPNITWSSKIISSL